MTKDIFEYWGSESESSDDENEKEHPAFEFKGKEKNKLIIHNSKEAPFECECGKAFYFERNKRGRIPDMNFEGIGFLDIYECPFCNMIYERAVKKKRL